MDRYHSTGVSTLVALMAAHREAANSSGPVPVFNQAAVAEVNRYLAGSGSPPAAQLHPALEIEDPHERT